MELYEAFYIYIYIYIYNFMTMNARLISKNDFIYDCADASQENTR